MRDTDRYRDFYEAAAPTYDEHRYETAYGRVFRTLHHAAIRSALSRYAGGDGLALDVACGTGHATRLLLEMDLRVVSTDISATPYKTATDLADHPRNSFTVADAFSLPFSDSCFDIVVATRFLHLFPYKEQNRAVSELVRVLRPGGTLVVDFDNRVSAGLLLPALVPYNLFRYGRLVPDTHYNSTRSLTALLEGNGVEVRRVAGVGGYHLVLPALISTGFGARLGRLHYRRGWRMMAEQLLATGRKR